MSHGRPHTNACPPGPILSPPPLSRTLSVSYKIYALSRSPGILRWRSFLSLSRGNADDEATFPPNEILIGIMNVFQTISRGVSEGRARRCVLCRLPLDLLALCACERVKIAVVSMQFGRVRIQSKTRVSNSPLFVSLTIHFG